MSRDSTARPETEATTSGTTNQPDGTRQGLLDRTQPGATEDPETSPTPDGPPCPEQQPSAAVLLSPSETSAATDKDALVTLFEATGGESWDTSGTWGGRAPIEDWQGVTVNGEGRVAGISLSGLTGELPSELSKPDQSGNSAYLGQPGHRPTTYRLREPAQPNNPGHPGNPVDRKPPSRAWQPLQPE